MSCHVMSHQWIESAVCISSFYRFVLSLPDLIDQYKLSTTMPFRSIENTTVKSCSGIQNPDRTANIYPLQVNKSLLEENNFAILATTYLHTIRSL